MPLLGGALSVTSESWNGFPESQHWYDITADNARASGFTVVEPWDDNGLRSCAANLRCFIPMGVDWRFSAATVATAVLAEVNRVLADTHADRVDILAHSQGGLVAAALAQNPSAVGKIYRIVTLGTPFLGAPKALTELLLAEPCQFPANKFGFNRCLIDPTVIQRLMENYPGVAELVPPADYYTAASVLASPLTSNNHLLSYEEARATADQILANPPSGSGLVARDGSLLDAANSFHAQIDRWAPADPSVGLLRMVGYDADSSDGCGAAPCPASQLGRYQPLPVGDPNATITGVDVGTRQMSYGDGDGTVPLWSASVYNPSTGFDDRGGAHDLYWCGVSHFGLVWSSAVWASSLNYLTGATTYNADQVGGVCPDGTTGSLPRSLIGAQ
ncbi:MAG: hypothetical protein JOZ46_01390 [Candidatus Dormibacteraeota bacterium]|nr:hypothetical protein [Candidatus Dormibacteraeota bacterium]MBV9524448.1 hypothetical protein [Candidatus Dormibacteraeota bacterium]